MMKAPMLGKKFYTLTDWNECLKGRTILVINQSHKFRNEECDFIEMVGAHETLTHQKNKGGKKIMMKVKTKSGGVELLLKAKEFMVVEYKIPYRPNTN